MASPDGRIDPNGKTIKTLMNLANPVLLKYQLSARGVNLLKSIERLELRPYDDHTGKEVSEFVAGATIGYGHLIKENEWELYKNGITEQEARELIRKDFGSFVQLVNRLVKKQISMNQFDALVMFSFNIGPTAFRNSTVLKLINDPNIDIDSEDVEKSWKIFKYQGDKVKPSLINRRNCEWDIYTKNVYKMW